MLFIRMGLTGPPIATLMMQTLKLSRQSIPVSTLMSFHGGVILEEAALRELHG